MTTPNSALPEDIAVSFDRLEARNDRLIADLAAAVVLLRRFVAAGEEEYFDKTYEALGDAEEFLKRIDGEPT